MLYCGKGQIFYFEFCDGAKTLLMLNLKLVGIKLDVLIPGDSEAEQDMILLKKFSCYLLVECVSTGSNKMKCVQSVPYKLSECDLYKCMLELRK